MSDYCTARSGCGNAFSCLYPNCAKGEIDHLGLELADAPTGHGEYWIAPPGGPAYHLRLRRAPYRAALVRWGGAVLLAALGVAVLYLEGQQQPAPGVGFAIGAALLLAAGARLGRT